MRSNQFEYRAPKLAAALVLIGTSVLAFAVAAAIPATMQAARDDSSTPGSLKIETVDMPTPKDGQVLVRVYAAGLNPANWRVAGPRGSLTDAPPPPPPGMAVMGPRKPGNDVAGVVVALGGGVTDFKIGDKVVGALQQVGGGAYAQYAIALATVLAPKPKKFTFEQAAGMPTAGFTGLRMVLLADVKKGERVLVIGAAGGVGSTAVQVAKAEGAYVIGSAASQHNDYLKSIGVDQIVNYDKEKVGDKVKDVDVVINEVESENAASLTYLRRGGRLVLINGQPDGAACAAAGVTCSTGGPGKGPSDGDLLRQLVSMANAGTYKVQVEKVFPLSAINDAYAYGRSGNRQGKVILDVAPGAAKR